MKLPNEKQLTEYDKWDKPRPSHEEHNTEDSWEHPLGERLIQAKCWNWHMEGNILCCDTDFGPLRQNIPTDYICFGEKDGLPLLRKVL